MEMTDVRVYWAFTTYSQIIQRQGHYTPQGGHTETAPRKCVNRVCGDSGRREELQESAFIEGQVGEHSKRCKGISLVHVNVTRSQSGVCRKDLWQKSAPWCSWPPRQGAHSQFMEILRQQENMTFWNLQDNIIQLFYMCYTLNPYNNN